MEAFWLQASGAENAVTFVAVSTIYQTLYAKFVMCNCPFCFPIITWHSNDTWRLMLFMVLPRSCWIYFRIHRDMFVFSIVSWQWGGTGNWNDLFWKSRNCLFCMTNTIVALVQKTPYIFSSPASMDNERFDENWLIYRQCWLRIDWQIRAVND